MMWCPDTTPLHLNSIPYYQYHGMTRCHYKVTPFHHIDTAPYLHDITSYCCAITLYHHDHGMTPYYRDKTMYHDNMTPYYHVMTPWKYMILLYHHGTAPYYDMKSYHHKTTPWNSIIPPYQHGMTPSHHKSGTIPCRHNMCSTTVARDDSDKTVASPRSILQLPSLTHPNSPAP